MDDCTDSQLFERFFDLENARVRAEHEAADAEQNEEPILE